MNYNNSYFVLRHGNSLGNQEKIIVSDLEIGSNNYGLTKLGIKQVKNSLKLIEKKDYIIYSSPFKRASETAVITAEILGVSKINYSNSLIERYFGDFDLKSCINYKKVWEQDLIDPINSWNNVESVSSVFKRTTSLIDSLEKLYSNKNILLVSHGDSSQILECSFKNIDPKLHRSLITLKQAEFRALYIKE